MADLSFYTGFMEMAREKGMEKTALWTAEKGFSSVEVLEIPSNRENFLAKNVKEALHVQQVLKENGLHVSCLSAALNLWEEKNGVEDLERMMEIVAALGSPFLHHMLISWLFYPEGAPSYEEALPIILEKAHKVAETAKSYGLTCLYEGQGLYFNGVKGVKPFLEAMKKDHDNVGIVGDMGNPLFAGCDPKDFIAAFAEDIKHVHLKDYTIRTFDENPGRPYLATESGKSGIYVLDQLPGDGDIDLVSCMQSLKAVGYQGAYSIESSLGNPISEDAVETTMQWCSLHI